MKIPMFVVVLALAQAGTVLAQATERADAKAGAVEAARAPKYGEAEAPAAAKPKATPAQRQAARGKRHQDGAAAARTHGAGEGNPVPEAAAKVPKEQRVAARADRKTESRRANKAGEITSRGEKSY